MANYTLTKKVIDDNIRRNGRRAITGPVLNAVLTQMLSTLGIGGYKLGGVVSPGDTFVPGDADMFFVATQPGTYADFGGFVLNEGEIGFLSFNGEWHNTAVSAGGSIDAYTKAESDDKFATKGALQELSGNVGSISTNLTSEIQRATSAESALSQRIDTIVQGRNVRDIVGNYAELEAYDTSTLGDNDIVMVLLDNTKSGHTTYYRWKQTEGEWEFIGGLAFTYTKTEIDAKFSALHIVLPTIPADAQWRPEDYQELLAQVDAMVRGAGADASFKLPIADVGNVDVTFVKTNPANVYLGLFADQESYLYRIIRTTTTPRVYSCEIVFKSFYTDGEVDSIIDDAIRDVVRSIPFIGVSATQSQLSEVYEAVVAHPNAVYRFDNGIVVASVKVENQPAPFEPSVILKYYDGEYIRTLTIDKVVDDDDDVEYQILRQFAQLAPMASLTQLENNVVKLNGNQFISGDKTFYGNLKIPFDNIVDPLTNESIDNVITGIVQITGDPSSLITEDKSSLVGGINENAEKLTALQTKVGDLSQLHTTEKSNLVDAINELAQGGGGGGEIEKLIGILSTSETLYKGILTDGRYFARVSLPTKTDISRIISVPSGLTSFSYLFGVCTNLTKVDCSSWDTSNVATFSEVFSGCTSLKEVDVNNWNTSKATNFFGAFYNTPLEIIDISNWDMTKALSVQAMFRNCRSLRRVELCECSFEALTTVAQLFEECTSLEYVDLSRWEGTSGVGNFGAFLMGCASLKEVDLRGWDASSATSTNHTLTRCSALTTLIGGSQSLDEVVFNGLPIYLRLNDTQLDRPSIRAVINGLADLTNTTSQTLQMGNILKAKLTAEDIAIATTKNWIIA